MKFIKEKFLIELEQYKINPLEEVARKKKISNVGKVLKHLWYHDNPSSIDFDAFTLQDIADAKDVIASLPYSWDEGGESFICDPSNALVKLDLLLDIPSELVHSKNKLRKIDCGDEFI